MSWAVIAVTRKGAYLAQEIAAVLQQSGDCIQYTLEKYVRPGQIPFTGLAKLTENLFHEADGLVFVSACGIAVRSIAPYLVSKTSDPAVLVVDESGKHVISLLSGHIGGANAFTERIAVEIGAEPVITTATDTGSLFSPDSFAVANELYICEMEEAKRVAAEVLNEQPVGFYSDYPYRNLVPELKKAVWGETDAAGMETGICIMQNDAEQMFTHTLHLLPRNLVLGAGCRKGIDADVFEEVVLEQLRSHGIRLERICAVATIDLKKEEPALLRFCERHHLPLHCYSAEQLKQVEGTFTGSEFVRKTTGVENVCERSAVALAKEGSLILHKQAKDGVTVAVAEKPVMIDFAKKRL